MKGRYTTMFENIIKTAEKNGLTAKEYNLQSGYFYNGKDNVFVYPCITFTCNRDLSGKNLSQQIEIIEKIAKRNKLVKIDNGLTFNYWYMRYTTKENSEKSKEAYSKYIRFSEGFWMKKHNNKEATQEELIAAGNENLIKYGYVI